MTPASAAVAQSLLPVGVLGAFLFCTAVLFAARCLALGRPRTPNVEARAVPTFWKWGMEWWIWLWGPVERACLALGVGPTAITLASTVICAAGALTLGAGHLAIGGWLYLAGSSLDLVDGRVARAQGTASPAGAFLDSTLDRLSELLAFGALAVYFRDSPALLAPLCAGGASVLVSYARARGEGLGVSEPARVGGMQRAERVALTGAPCALSPVADALMGPGGGALLTGSALALLAIVSAWTALRRGHAIWRALRGPRPAPGPLSNVRWLDAARRRERLGR